MRKPLLLLFLFNFCFYAHAQEVETAPAEAETAYLGKNELKLNGVYLLGGFPEFTYERVLNEESAVGISVAFSVDKDIDMNFMALPYYRIYFGKKPAAGFFVEGNAAIYGIDYYQGYYYDDYYERKESSEVGAGIGLAVGAKFLTKGGWVFEIFGGAGRNLLNTDEAGEAYPRFGLTVGKRF